MSFLPWNFNIYIYIYTNLPVNAIVRLPHPHSGDTQGQETFLAPSADKQTRNYDTRVLKPTTIRLHQPKCQRDWAVARWNGEQYTNLYINLYQLYINYVMYKRQIIYIKNKTPIYLKVILWFLSNLQRLTKSVKSINLN